MRTHPVAPPPPPICPFPPMPHWLWTRLNIVTRRSIVRIPPLQQLEHHSERQPQQPTTQPHSNKTFCMATLFLCVLIASNQFVYFSNKCHPPICSSCRVVATTPTNTINLYYKNYYYYYYYYYYSSGEPNQGLDNPTPTGRAGRIAPFYTTSVMPCLSQLGDAVVPCLSQLGDDSRNRLTHMGVSSPFMVRLCCGCVWLFVVRCCVPVFG